MKKQDNKGVVFKSLESYVNNILAFFDSRVALLTCDLKLDGTALSCGIDSAIEQYCLELIKVIERDLMTLVHHTEHAWVRKIIFKHLGVFKKESVLRKDYSVQEGDIFPIF